MILEEKSPIIISQGDNNSTQWRIMRYFSAMSKAKAEITGIKKNLGDKVSIIHDWQPWLDHISVATKHVTWKCIQE